MGQWGVGRVGQALRLLDKPTRAVRVAISSIFDHQTKSPAIQSRDFSKQGVGGTVVGIGMWGGTCVLRALQQLETQNWGASGPLLPPLDA